MEYSLDVYHGTTITCAKKIIGNNIFYPSSKKNEWLGEGVYFFQEKYYANWWAKKKIKQSGEKVCVVTALIRFTDKQFVDFDLFENLQRMADDIAECERLLRQEKAGYPAFQSKAERMCFSCNCFKQMHPEIKVLAYSYAPVGFPDLCGFAPRQRQFCVHGNDVIHNIAITEG